MKTSLLTEWTKISQLGVGGTAVSLAHSSELDEKIWIGSPAGLFTLNTQNNMVNPVVHEIPFASVHAIVLAGDTLLVAGLPANLIYSSDGGKHWLRATIEGANRPFTSLAPSPNILHDGVVLAGTAGQGIMRSSDGGRYWEFTTFGLDDYNVLVVACAPIWKPEQNSQEIALAGTANGVFQSPNGGRAWRKCQTAENVSDAIVQSICFSPDFAHNQTVFAGTEAHGLLISTDAGLTWAQHPTFPANRSVTALLNWEDEIVAATGRGEVYTSADQSETWDVKHQLDFPITCLGKTGSTLIAGLVDGGLHPFGSDQPVDGALRRFGQLRVNQNSWEVDEPPNNQWVSIDAGQQWDKQAQSPSQPTLNPPLNNVMHHVANGAVSLGADRKTVEVWIQAAAGETWKKVGAHIAYGRAPRLAVLETGDNPTVALALGPNCLILNDGKWESYKVGSEGAPLTAIIGRPNGQIACSTFDSLHLFDGEAWTAVPAPDNQPLNDLALTAENELVALTTNGTIYHYS